MSIWTINGSSPESLGLSVTRGRLSSGSASEVYLTAIRNFDASEVFAYNSVVTISRDGSAFFRGKVRQIPKSGSGSSEAQDYLVEDAWAELERLPYQEPWLIRQPGFSGVIWSPRVILGMTYAGSRINVGQQISEALTFAVAQGVALTVGSIPTGMMLWPSEAIGLSCAQVIRDCLRFYPDWIPWLNHSTNPPTFNVTPRGSATALGVAVTACSTLDVTRTHDRVPTGVRIVYESVNAVDNETFRIVEIHQAPRPAGLSDAAWLAMRIAPAGDGVMVTHIPLAGMQAQIQKQQVTVRAIPTTQALAKPYLKEKLPVLNIFTDDSRFNVTAWGLSVVPEPDPVKAGKPVEPIDVKLERLYGSGLTGANGLKNELLDGSLPEWIQRRVGRVMVKFKVAKASGVTLTEEEEEALASVPPWFVVVATNATTRIYKGVSSFEPTEDVPEGVAAAFYETMVGGCNYAGSITTQDEELPGDLGHGRVLNLTGSEESAWASMRAPIHTVTWDIATATVTRDFGPNPDLSVEDFSEFLKLLNKREYSSFTSDERASDEIGNGNGPSANGDTVGSTWFPKTITGGGAGGEASTFPFQLVATGTPGDNKLNVLASTIASLAPPGFDTGKKEFTISDSAGQIYAKMTINATTGAVVSVAVEKGSDVPANTDTIYYELIGNYSVEGSGGSAVISAFNVRYGPIPALICRDWYVSEAPFFTVTFS